MHSEAHTFKVLTYPKRLQLLQLLSNAGKQLCVCELVDSLAIPQYAVSKHLKELERAGFIKSDKDGRWVYYSIQDNLDSLKKELVQAIRKIPDTTQKDIQNRLEKRLQMRVNGKCLLGIQNTKLTSGGNSNA